MKEYMTTLYLRFCGPPEHNTEAEELGQQLREQLNKEQRRALLKLIDQCNAHCEAQAEAAFIAGFRLAAGIAMELRGGWYSFMEEEDHRRSKCRLYESTADPIGERSDSL